jgi:hypothetical protein
MCGVPDDQTAGGVRILYRKGLGYRYNWAAAH